MTHTLDMKHLALASLALPGIGRKTAIDILSATSEVPQTPEEFEVLVRSVGGSRTKAIGHTDAVAALDRAARILEEAAELGIQVFCIADTTYPERLLSIPDPPAVLFARGSVDSLSRPEALAIIGTRKPTDFGYKAAHRLALRCAEAGIVVVSGLAIGCDARAHEGCLDGEGVTIAVLAHGVDSVHPVVNRPLAERILVSGGVLVSEYAPGEKPRRNFFVERDRIQSALSRAVLVIETDIKGGTMHTVRFARTQGREIACLVHPETFRSEAKTQGNQKLILDGVATAIGSASDLTALIDRARNGDHDSGSDAESIRAVGLQLELWGADHSGGGYRS